MPGVTNSLKLEATFSVKFVEMGVTGLQLLLLRAFKWGTGVRGGGGECAGRIKMC
jgi:hypothetical protein